MFLGGPKLLRIRSRSRRREGAGGPSRLDIPLQLSRERGEGGKKARGQPTAPRRARTWRRRPRRRRLSEEVGPLTAEPATRRFSLQKRAAGTGTHRSRQCRLGCGPGRHRAQHPRSPQPWAPRPPASWTRASAPTSEVCLPGDPGDRRAARALAPEETSWAGARSGSRPPRPALYLRARRSLCSTQGGCSWTARPGRAGLGMLGEAPREARERQVQAAGWGKTSFPPLRPPGARSPRPPTHPGQKHLAFLSLDWVVLSCFWTCRRTPQGISLASGDFPGDSWPTEQNFPPGLSGLVL